MDKFCQICTELLPFICVENWFPCSISCIFLADCLQTLYMSWYLGGMVWDCRWIDFVKLAQSYCPWFVWKMGFCALSRSFFGRLSSNFVLIRSGWRHNRYIVSNARNKNSELLAFYRHDFIIFNHFPKVLIDPKSKTRGEKSQTIENNSFCKAGFPAFLVFPSFPTFS